MAKGKHSAAAAARRAAAADAERLRLKAELEVEQVAHAASVARLKAEMHESNVRWMAEFENRLEERFDAEAEQRITAKAEALFAERLDGIRRNTAEVVGKWMSRTDVKLTMSAHADLVRDLDLADQSYRTLHAGGDNPHGNRQARRMTPKKAKAHAELLSQAGLG